MRLVRQGNEMVWEIEAEDLKATSVSIPEVIERPVEQSAVESTQKVVKAKAKQTVMVLPAVRMKKRVRVEVRQEPALRKRGRYCKVCGRWNCKAFDAVWVEVDY
jgi:hypothetical protein